MGDTDQTIQSWFDLATDYVNFIYKLSENFKTVSIEERREIFQCVYCNPMLTDKTLISSNAKPHNFIILAKAENSVDRTREKLF